MSLKIKNYPYNETLLFDEYNFELSDFQKWSIDSWEKNLNVLITAHTGSGKTLPAEYAINKIKNNNLGKLIYTCPIKSLSNDKYKSLKEKFPDIDIGIITGDIKFNPDAQILIMTTEILRNLLYNNKIEDVKNKLTIEINMDDIHTVVFDEVHYINDIDRGTVWEECFILLPSKINLINLSATIDNPEHFCIWLSKIKNKDIVLTSTEKRIVPLKHAIFIDYLHSYLNKKEGFSSEEYNNKLITYSDETNKFNIEQYVKVSNHLKKTSIGLSNNQIVNKLVEYLDINLLTPAIFFSFSRKNCEKLAHCIHYSLLKENELSLIEKTINFHLKKSNNYQSYIQMEQFKQLKKCLDKGIAFHHSGLLPIFKELVEILFSYKNSGGKLQPLIKILFATETFAVGVNMPTKTVVFTNIQKWSNNEQRYLKSHEFLQMSGRAGRRGIDSSGLVILLPNMHKLPSEHIMKSILLGKSQIIESKFKPNYKIVIKSIMNNNNFLKIGTLSLINKELQSQISVQKKELEKINCPDIDINKINEYLTIKENNYGFFKPSKKIMKENQKKIKNLEKDETFNKSYQLYLENKDIINEKNKIVNEIKNSEKYLDYQINAIKEILIDKKYIEIKDDNYLVTVKGIVASEINECNELILTELITNNLLDNLDYKQLACVLSIFCDSKLNFNKNNDITETNNQDIFDYTIYKSILEFVEQISNDYEKLEIYKHLYINTDWNYTTDIMNATYQWLNGTEFDEIIKKFNLYEGNLIKDFIKIYNLSANVNKIGEILNKVSLSIESNKIMDNIMKDVVTIESLYINNN